MTEYTTDLSSGYSQVLKAEIGTSTVYYTRGFELISRREGTTASYYIYDGDLSVRALTNEAGTVTDTLVFDAFGNETGRTGTTDNPYGFQGEEQDSTGLYYLRARYMDPATGTFTTMDTYGGSLSDPMSLHKYLFANSNPVMYCDPSGHVALTQQEATIAIQSIIGAAMSGIFYIADWLINDPDSKNHSFSMLLLNIVKGAALGALGAELGIGLLGLKLSITEYFAIAIIAEIASLEFKDMANTLGDYSNNPIVYGVLDGIGDTTKMVSNAAIGVAFVKAMEGQRGSTQEQRIDSRETGNKYKTTSWWKRLTTRQAKTIDLKPNPLDPYSDPKIGPNESAVRQYIDEIRMTGTISEPIRVKELASGGYEIVDGHHRWLAALMTNLKYVPIEIINE
jgi:RHS repeat-associated protein